MFWAKGAQYLLDYHVWVSVWLRPAYSRFTRAQRLSCCLCLLMSYMAVNAAWYKDQTAEVACCDCFVLVMYLTPPVSTEPET